MFIFNDFRVILLRERRNNPVTIVATSQSRGRTMDNVRLSGKKT